MDVKDRTFSLNRWPIIWPTIIIFLGLLERAVWLLHRANLGYAEGESGNVALAFARTGTISDVFARGSGLTAHLNPLLPAFAGEIYNNYGVRSEPSELILAGLSLSLSCGAFAFYFCFFSQLGSKTLTKLLALAGVSLLPLNFSLEAIDFRIWEGALASIMAAANLCLIMQLDMKRHTAYRTYFSCSLIASLVLFVNPALGLSQFVCLFIWIVRNATLKRATVYGIVSALALIAVLTPWTIRNYQAFGHFIPLRANAGLELALANHPAAAAASAEEDGAVFVRRLKQIHPEESDEAFAKMQGMGGESNYANDLGREAQTWILNNPTAFVRLCLKHFAQFYFPPSWQWTIYGNESHGTEFKVMTFAVISFFGLLGASMALLIWRGRWIYVAAAVLVPVLPYLVTQPVPRYRYIVFTPLVFVAAELIARIATAWRTMRLR